jgi:DNA-binding MarR family transcriptional regulator
VSVTRYGYELPLLLAAGFRTIIDQLHAELAAHGHPQARPLHGFALQAIGADGITVSELGRRLGVSKQAATKTAASLAQAGYARRVTHPSDQRAVLIERTASGEEMLALSAAIFERIHAELAARIGGERLAELEADLARISPTDPPPIGDLPGWLTQSRPAGRRGPDEESPDRLRRRDS